MRSCYHCAQAGGPPVFDCWLIIQYIHCCTSHWWPFLHLQTEDMPCHDNRDPLTTGCRTYLLTPWCRVLLERLTGLQIVKKFPAFHGTRRFITTLISVCPLSLSWASPIQSIYSHPTSWRSILLLSTHLCLGLPSGLFCSGFPSKTLYTPLSENQNKLLVLQLHFTDQTRHTELQFKQTINFSHAVLLLAFTLILDYEYNKHLETCWVQQHLYTWQLFYADLKHFLHGLYLS